MSHLVHSRRFALFLLLSWCGVLFFVGLGSGELWRTEGLRALIASECLRNGNWIVPTLYGQPLLTKPPGAYIAIALASWPMGAVTDVTARLPSALAATLTVLLYYWYFARQVGRPAGLLAAAVLPASLLWLDKAPSAEIDILQVFWISAAILFALRAVEGEEDRGSKIEDGPWQLTPRSSILDPRSSILWWLAALLCVAGGVLTKWTAPVFFYATVVPLLWWRGRLRLLFQWPHLLSAALGAALCLGWAAWAATLTGWEPFWNAVSREALQHLSPGYHEETVRQLGANHQHRLGYWNDALTFPFLLLAMTLPWSAFALWSARPAFGRALNERERRLWQALHCWTWPNLLIWSLLPDPSPRHAAPLLPGLSGLAALVWLQWLRGWWTQYGSWRSVLAARPAAWSLPAFLIGWCMVKVVFVAWVVPARTAERQPRERGAQLAEHVPPDRPVYLFRMKDEGIMFYCGRTGRRLENPRELPSSGEPMYCILLESEWLQWPPSRPARIVLRSQTQQGAPILLVEVDPDTPVSGARQPPVTVPQGADASRLRQGREQSMSFPTVPAGVKVLSVGDLTRSIKDMLEGGFPSVWVAGEISNLARPSSGHLYLTLKDADAQLRAVIWRSVGMRLRFDPKDGLEVIARGRLSVYPPRGEYQLVIEELQPKGLGAQELALRQLRERLFRLGYFEKARKKPLPRFPRRLALVTSPSGAAVRDMLEILGRRWPRVEVWVCPAKMQGEGAAQEIAAAVRLVNRLHLKGTLRTDVMILGRGGGSIEDLWAFQEEVVAQAIFASSIPVVSAVGHEIDVTTADLVADHRAETPSVAAAVVVPDRAELLLGMRDLEDRLRVAVMEQLQQRRQRLDDLAGRRAFRLPLERVRDLERRLDDWSERLRRAVRQRHELAEKRLEGLAAQLASLSPLNVLARGYSLTRRETDHAVVRRPEQVSPGDRLVTIVEHGTIVSRVEELQPTASSPSDPRHGCPPAARMQS